MMLSLLTVGAMLLVGAGTASASCDKTWTGSAADGNWFNSANWSPTGVPTGTQSVCIAAGTPTAVIDGAAQATAGNFAQASSLNLDGTLTIQGDTSGTSPNQTELSALLVLFHPSTITSNGQLNLTTTCGDVNACTDGGAATVAGNGIFDNEGTISVKSGTDGGAAKREITGVTLLNNGVVQTDGNGASLLVDGGTFKEGTGTTSPASSPLTAFPTDPAVIVSGVGASTSLWYFGTGASTIVAQGPVALQGNLGSSQNVVVEGQDGSSCTTGVLSAISSFTNAGTITLARPGSLSCGSELSVGPASATSTSATLTNTGTIQTVAAGAPGTTYLNGNIVNNGGTINVATFTQYEGTDPSSTAFSGATLDNQGTISVHSSRLTVASGAGATVNNDTGGLICNTSSCTAPTAARPRPFLVAIGSYLAVEAGDTFEQGAGTTDPAGSAGPNVSPAVLLDGGLLDYTGTGNSAVSANPTTSLEGAIGSSQELLLVAEDIGCQNKVTDAGNLTNAGTLVFSAASGYGCLQVGGGTGTLTNTGTIIVNHSQVNDEPRQIDGSLNNSTGDLELGNSGVPAPLTLTGSYTQGSGGTLTVPINGATTPGTDFGQLVANGSTLDGTLALVTGFTPSTGESFKILDDGSAANSGTFSSITGQFPAGQTSGYEPLYHPSDVTLSYQALNALAVTLTGKGTGTVTSSPSGISCGSTCNASFFADRMVTLTASPAGGSTFAGWSGDCTGTTTMCQVAMSQARSVTARFTRITATHLISSKNPALVHHAVVYTATVTPAPDGGTVKFTDNGKTVSGCAAKPVSHTTGRATCSVTYSAAAKHSISALYSGDADYAKSHSNTLTETVKP